MNMPMCSRCKKNIAVVFITKIEGPDKTTQEGLCLKCARRLGVKPLDATLWNRWALRRTTSRPCPVRSARCPI
ncbi:MAG: hypothetical protein ACLR4Z_06245 [Butyricicoccaceae bacterium]